MQARKGKNHAMHNVNIRALGIITSQCLHLCPDLIYFINIDSVLGAEL